MRLKLLLPTHVLVDREVAKVVAEAENGALCLLPRHVDFVAALAPGLLSFTTDDDGEEFAAVDEGVLVKCGPEVLVSTRNAVLGHNLGTLRDAVAQQFRVFIATSNLLGVVPGFQSPTGSLSTTVGLALRVFVAVPVCGIAQRGVKAYLQQYLQPSAIMLPFNAIGEFSRTLALAMRLFGNVMSGGMIVAVLLSIRQYERAVESLLDIVSGFEALTAEV